MGFATKTRLSLGVVLALVVAVATLYSWNGRRLAAANGWVAHTQQVRTELEALAGSFIEVESGVRGFVATGDESYLANSDRAAREVAPRLARLEALSADNPKQQKELASLSQLAREKLEFNERLVALRRRAFEPARALLATRRGLLLMDRIRASMDALRAEEESLLARRVADAAHLHRLAYPATALLALLLLATLVLFALSIRNDLRERRKADALLRASAEKLQASNRELQDFAMVASHDLQEPLRKIQMFGDKLRRKYAPALGEEGLDYLNRMSNAAARGQSLIQGLLQFSRVTTRGQPPSPVDLTQTAREVVSDLEARLADVQGRVEIGELPIIEADPLQMRQLLQNLIGNALKFRKPDLAPVVRVQGGPPVDGRVQLAVADNGIGFEQKYVDRIFKLFQRLHERGAYEGSGMGLAICRKIVERHGGNITARSRPGEGTTFLVELPEQQGSPG